VSGRSHRQSQQVNLAVVGVGPPAACGSRLAPAWSQLSRIGTLTPDPPATNSSVPRLGAAFRDGLRKGAKPADLPIEQLATFDCVINEQPARGLGLGVPSRMSCRQPR